jgi:hypothetical protein
MTTTTRFGEHASLLSIPVICLFIAVTIFVVAVLRKVGLNLFAVNESVSVHVRSLPPDSSPTCITINISHNCVPKLQLPPVSPTLTKKASSSSLDGFAKSSSDTAAAALNPGETKKNV